jgi:hypothetical protein
MARQTQILASCRRSRELHNSTIAQLRKLGDHKSTRCCASGPTSLVLRVAMLSTKSLTSTNSSTAI